MKTKKIAGKIARTMPLTGKYLKEHQRYVGELQATIRQLEARNDKWAEEVRQLRGENDLELHVLWPVFKDDLIAADYRQAASKTQSFKRHKPPYVINWVIPPVGSVSGGHAVIMYLINFLESQGHVCRIYVYDALQQSSLAEVERNMNNHVPVQAKIFYNSKNMADCDAIFATSWPTAYPVYNYQGKAKKFYLIQDFEPMFEPSGTYSTLAENTYKFNLHGVSSTPFTTKKVVQYGMKADEIELGINPSEYHLTNNGKRKKVVFYARPVTPRRGFELGVLALEIFHKKHPEYEINCIGWDISKYDITFPYVSHGILSTEELNELYNQCAASLVFSFTSMSLTVVEMMAAGCVPVMNNGPDSQLVSYKKHLHAVEPNPVALADGLFEAVELQNKNPNHAKKVADYAKQFDWNKYNHILQKILVKELS